MKRPRPKVHRYRPLLEEIPVTQSPPRLVPETIAMDDQEWTAEQWKELCRRNPPPQEWYDEEVPPDLFGDA